jgi:flagellar hook-basal body complex protein FliE
MPVGAIEGSALSMMQPHAPYDGGSLVRAPIDGGGVVRGPANPATEGVPTTSFASLFEDAVARANAMSHVAHSAAADLAAGRTDDIHGTMIEVQKASIEMKLVGNIRNKVVDAFYELWRMNV